ncbi:GNAT family N-acetyltransferase [Roseovarius sp. S1116L3]|uniref:GNAT family N-acetyltransferase n=1 Tax=Roseovarius roseus TaxID=3342636 RepID=UPI0037272D4E
MTTPELIEGPSLSLRLVTPEDADYIHALRLNPDFNVHLSQVTGTVEDQRNWIDSYKRREAEGREYYYVIQRRGGGRCGVVRLYDIQGDRFTWGSWILDGNKPPKAALESAVLSLGVGFDILGCQMALIDVRKENHRALSFYRRFGMTEIDEDADNYYFELSAKRFEDQRIGFREILRKDAP